MGMFDSLYDSEGNEWQTKAYNCMLEQFHVGDQIPGDRREACNTYQLAIFGGRDTDPGPLDSLATIRNGRVESINVPRDATLPLMDYHGGPPYFPEGE